MLAHHFSHYYSQRFQRMVLEAASAINPSLSKPTLKVATTSRNRSSLAYTSECGHAISYNKYQ